MRNLKECIDLFNQNELLKCHAVRLMEGLSEWYTASQYWAKLGRLDDSNACIMIHNSIERGNSYREQAKPLLDWVEETVNKEIMSKEDALKVISTDLQLIYKSWYG